MLRQVRLRTLFLLVALGVSFGVCAQSQHPDTPHAKFAVDTSGPNLFYGVGTRDKDVRFSADVSDASSYELDFGDDVAVVCRPGDDPVCGSVKGVQCKLEPNSDHVISCIHRYNNLRKYTVELKAVRTSGETITPLQMLVAVEPPPSVPEPVTSEVIFSATLSDPEIYKDIVLPEKDLTFTAYIDDAESYELDFGDEKENIERNIDPDRIEPRSGDRGGIRHVYQRSGNYKAVVKAWSNRGDQVKNEVIVTVRETSPLPDLFTVDHTEANSPFGAGSTSTDFVFTADVAEALRYELDFGDGLAVTQEIAPGTGRSAIRFPPHRYEAAGNYTAILNTSRTTGGPSRIALGVSVKAPPMVVEDPVVERRTWPWLLILSALAVLLGTYVLPTPVATGTGDVTFEPRVDSGRIRVLGSTRAEDAVAMRVRRNAASLKVIMNNGEPQ